MKTVPVSDYLFKIHVMTPTGRDA